MLRETPEGTYVPIKVVPHAKENAVMGWENGELKIRLRAPPEKGRANAALLEFLAELLSLPIKDLTLVKGATSRHKLVFIKGTFPDIKH